MSLPSSPLSESLCAVLAQSLSQEVKDCSSPAERRSALDGIARRLHILLQHAPTPEGHTVDTVIQRAHLAAQIEAALYTLHQQARPS